MRHPATIGRMAVLLVATLFLADPARSAGQDRLANFVRVSSPATSAGAPVEYQGRFSGYTNYWQTIGLELASARQPVPHRPARRRAGHRPEQGRHSRGAGHSRTRPRRGLSRRLAPVRPSRTRGPGAERPWKGSRPRRRPRLGQAVEPPGPEAAGQGPRAGRRPGRAGKLSSRGRGLPRAHRLRARGWKAASLRGRLRRRRGPAALQGAPRGRPRRRRPLRSPPRLVRDGDAPPQRHLPSRPSARGHRPGPQPGQRLVHLQRLHGLHDAETAAGVAPRRSDWTSPSTSARARPATAWARSPTG